LELASCLVGVLKTTQGSFAYRLAPPTRPEAPGACCRTTFVRNQVAVRWFWNQYLLSQPLEDVLAVLDERPGSAETRRSREGKR
jgi:hypothetical protein